MASQYEVEITIASARDLKNVNWRYGDLNAYVVAWVDPSAKCSTKVAVDGDTNPVWDEKLTLPLTVPLQDAALYLDVVHAGSAKDTKPLVGSARLYLREVVDDVGVGGKTARTLKLRRPSGRPQGKVEVKVAVKEPARYYGQGPAPAAYAPPYSQPSSRGVDYGYPQSYGAPQPYAAAPPAGYPYGTAPPPPTGYPYGAPPPVAAPAPSGYGAPPPSGYGAPVPSGYGAPAAAYGQDGGKKSKFGMGTGLAVGAAAGVLGGLVLAEGIEHVEDSIADKAAEKVEDNLYYNDDDGGYDDGGGFDF